MSISTEWARAASVGVTIIDEYEDAYGQGLDEGGIALILSTDGALVIEAADTDELRALAQRIITAADRWDA